MPEDVLRIKQAAGAVEIALHVQPRARKDEIAGNYNGALKVKVTAPPVDDAANKAIIHFFAGLLDLPKSHLKIISGEKSRGKILRIEGVSLAHLLSRIQ